MTPDEIITAVKVQAEDAAQDTMELAERVLWLERGLRFIAEGKTDRPKELARQVLKGHVWLPEWQ